ncbi:sensor histidine kinase, partial [Streptomyces solincola]
MTTTGAEQGAAGRTTRGWWWWERRRGAVLDVVLAVLSAAECAAEGVEFSRNAGVPTALG